MRTTTGGTRLTSQLRQITGNVSVGAGVTTYAEWRNMAFFDATETNRLHFFPTKCRITRLAIKTTTTQPSTGTLVYTLRRNQSDTSLVLTVASNSAAGFYSADGSVIFTARNSVSIKCVNNASTTSATVGGGGVVITSTSNKATRSRTLLSCGGYQSSIPANTTRWPCFSEQSGGMATVEDTGQMPMIVDCTIESLFFKTGSTQSSTGALVYTLRKNQADTALVVTIAANAAAGEYYNESNPIKYKAGDWAVIKAQNLATATSCQLYGYCVTITS